jgi:dimethylargininase
MFMVGFARECMKLEDSIIIQIRRELNQAMSLLALTHAPSPQMQACVRTFVQADAVDVGLVQQQHAAYCHALRQCGAVVEVLNVNGDSPDAVFIEDTAVVLDEVAILTAMGTPSRQTEPAGLEAVLRKHRPIERITRGTLEGGDVLKLGRTLLVGQSCRTSAAGIESLAEVVRPFGYRVVGIPVELCLHLKTACTALPDGRLLVNPDWVARSALPEHELVAIPAAEPWGANVLPIGDHVLLPAAHLRTAEMLETLGFRVVRVALSEFAKAEGGATCLSLLLHP